MSARVFVDGVADARIAVDDRGLCYGDGLFETILFVRGEAPLWPRHMTRLRLGCERLSLLMPDAGVLSRESVATTAGLDRAVVRITVTRGSGPRGYAPPASARVLRIVAANPAPEIPPDWYHRGVRVRCCDLRLGEQPRLAGIKHLNRLENVLARAERSDAAIAEGLFRDARGCVISATAANIFAVIDGRLVTPRLDRCGVAGTMRAQVMAWRGNCEERELPMDELLRADEVFLTNAVRGVVPVAALDDRAWPVGAVAKQLQRQWNALFSAGRAA